MQLRGLAVVSMLALASCRTARTPAPPVHGVAASESALLDDDFNGSSLTPSWTLINASQFTQQVTGGTLKMSPIKNCVWYMRDQGPGLVKYVTGNFKVTTSVKARQASHPTLPPPSKYQLAGLIARDPASEDNGRENYVFTVVGNRIDYLTNETKNTTDNDSDVQGPVTGRTEADSELRICRIDQTFRLYERAIGGTTWKLTATYDRASKPMPATLAVGPIAYTYTNTPDLVGEFDYVRFAPAGTPADCLSD